MKDKKRFRQVMVYLLIGVLAGVLAAVAQLLLRKDSFDWSQDQLILAFSWLVRVFYVMASLASASYFVISNRVFKKQETLEDDDQVGKAYLKAFRAQALANSLSYSGLLFCLPLVFMDSWLIQTKGTADFLILLTLDSLMLVFTFILAAMSVKNLKETRGIKMSLFATPKEGLEVIYQYDEGERTILFEEIFKAVYRLNVQIFPFLYILVLIFSIHQFQLLTLLILMGLHIYLNLVQYQAARKFYKN